MLAGKMQTFKELNTDVAEIHTSLLASQSISQPLFGPHCHREISQQLNILETLQKTWYVSWINANWCRFFTVLEPGRLSVWLLARILNLSVQASRSSFTPTTKRQVIMWGKSYLYTYLCALSLTFRRIVCVHTVPHVSEVAKAPRSESRHTTKQMKIFLHCINLASDIFLVTDWRLMCLKILRYYVPLHVYCIMHHWLYKYQVD